MNPIFAKTKCAQRAQLLGPTLKLAKKLSFCIGE